MAEKVVKLSAPRHAHASAGAVVAAAKSKGFAPTGQVDERQTAEGPWWDVWLVPRGTAGRFVRQFPVAGGPRRGGFMATVLDVG